MKKRARRNEHKIDLLCENKETLKAVKLCMGQEPRCIIPVKGLGAIIFGAVAWPTGREQGRFFEIEFACGGKIFVEPSETTAYFAHPEIKSA